MTRLRPTTTPRHTILTCALLSLIATATLLFTASCSKPAPPTVVVYTALDRTFSEPILKRFEEKTGIIVHVKYDTESTKTVGLVNTIRAEKNRPRCDVFWNNEIVNTIRLKNEGLLQPHQSQAALDFPRKYRDPKGYWFGFAARARVLLVNTDIVDDQNMPDSIVSLADKRWLGQTGIAKPLFGTTATHAACLFASLGTNEAASYFRAIKKNEVKVLQGNRTVAAAVAAGQIAFGLTDTDDAVAELEAQAPVRMIYPDSVPPFPGVLYIPNTLSLVAQCPNPENGRKLIEYLLSPPVEKALAMSKSCQIPLNPKVDIVSMIRTPAEVHNMEVDFEKAARHFDDAAAFIEKEFLE